MRSVSPYGGLMAVLLLFAHAALSQPGTSIEVKKPEVYESRVLGAEKTGLKKFSYPRRIFQNTITHYNYFFNGNNRLNQVITDASQFVQDDYTRMLPYYKYSLDMTSGNGDLDSVIYKCNAGILLHDLRNYWVDDLYLLLGKTYYFRKNFDSADQVFRYLAYAFGPKEEGGYDIPVGSNISPTGGVFSVATKENTSFSQKVFSTPPTRNEALLWQARNYIETERYGEAAGILEILKGDPVFPERLQDQLHEMLGYLYYRLNSYDSAATHLSKALGIAPTKQDKARMQFLTGQLYQMAGNDTAAIEWYEKCAETTIDPIMGVYANLNTIKVASGDTSANLLQQKLDNLMKMAKRDKYAEHRDLIYYALAQAELERNDTEAATQMLKNSIRYNAEDNPDQRSRSFMLMGDIAYAKADFAAAKNYYDSVNTGALQEPADQDRLNNRLPALTIIAENIDIIDTEDSLRTIAAMPKDKRDDAVKKMVRQLRKQQGLKEEGETFVNPAVRQDNPSDLFNAAGSTAQNAAGKNEWYFNNISLKGQGYNQFRAKWGVRQNTDNWRRSAAVKVAEEQDVEQANADQNQEQPGDAEPGAGQPGRPVKRGIVEGDEISFETLYAQLPLTDEQVKASDDNIAAAMFSTAETLQGQLENYEAAIEAYETLLKNYPGGTMTEQALFNLVYCYMKTGRKQSADSAKAALLRNFPDGESAAKLSNQQPVKQEDDPATVLYKDIYNLFLAGNFKKAVAEKEKADEQYGNSYWTPQLLYIESIYYVSTKQDSIAIEKLGQLRDLYAQTPLAEKAVTMIDVLQRRSEIESYLTKLEIKRYEEDASPVINLTEVKPTVKKVDIRRDSLVSDKGNQVVKMLVDSASMLNNPTLAKAYAFDPKEPQYVAVLLDQVAPVYITEAKNAFSRYNQITFYNQKLVVTPLKLDDRYNLVLIGPFSDAATAVTYVDKTKPVTSSRIVPWLAADKYAYTIISETNLTVMKETHDVDTYKKLMERVLPGKF